ncbi:oxygen-insensitive NADPH nitroreductase [Macrococcus brunensis]|uniref:oxygen-insensitive NADPH nitroreductase n=1 Tax=Macrococcus brunensis TaxID=198483 RepID=UPI001EF02127|nr:oxygen-insensitive NADPH nitroreductase [Macrococcus brunensis]ULG71468.1 oxygen-insensitive NADPH nitroreductase [Macrococcus brunensis]ULG73765.1 oxygen-insensitive NADPH nitroreductase [Macrococcus brunensis]
MNEVIRQLMNHRSIRQFTEEKLTEGEVRTLVEAAQMASTSSYLQAYSIMGVTDADKKAALRKVSGQPYVEENGHLFVFVADFHRHQLMSEKLGADINDYLGATESFLVGTVDAVLAAQNLAVAAESMGLGICYIGSLRNDMQQVIDILNLPAHVYPLFGMVVGHPEDSGSQKERLPFEHIYHENEYDSSRYADEITAYDEEIAAYYRERTNGKRADKWSEQVIGMLSEKTRLDVDDVVKKQGFLKQ